MLVQIVESVWDVESEALETVPFDTSSPKNSPYPLPGLKRTGRFAPASFRIISLENDYLKVVLSPDLGGRILHIHDKRTDIDTMPFPARIEPSSGSNRGVFWSHGIQFIVGDVHRPNSMGPVDFLVREDVGAVVLHEIVVGSNLGWHACVSLPEDMARVSVEVRTHNNSPIPAKCLSGLIANFGFPGGGAKESVIENGTVVYSETQDAGALFEFKNGAIATARSGVDGHALHRFSDVSHHLGPNEIDSWKIDIVPYSGLARLDFAHRDAGVCIEQQIRIQSARELAGNKLFVLDPNGGTLEAEVSLSPLKMFVAEMGFQPRGLVLKTAEGSEIFRAEGTMLEIEPGGHDFVSATIDCTMNELVAAARGQRPGSAEQAFYEARQSSIYGVPMMLKSAAHTSNAIASMRCGDFQQATESLDSALLTNSEDHYLWWLKVVCARHSGVEDTDQTSLLNAHYLAPLEPALRAESFLAMPSDAHESAALILKPLAANPDSILDVLCKFIACGLYIDAARIMDVAHGVNGVPLVRYLHAWCHLQSTNLEAEAAHHVQIASPQPLAPPFPWRTIEVQATIGLSQRFPGDSRLKTLAELVQAFGLT